MRCRMGAIGFVSVALAGAIPSDTTAQVTGYPEFVNGSVALDPQGAGNLYSWDLKLHGTLALVALNQGGLVVVDVSDPAVPAQIGRLDTPGTLRGLDAVGHVVYMADGNGIDGGNSELSGLVIADVSDPTRPLPLSIATTPGNAVDVEVRGDFAFVLDAIAEYDGPEALVVFDVSDARVPIEVARLTLPWHANLGVYFEAMDVEGSLAVVVTGPGAPYRPANLVTVDVSDPTNPIQLAVLNGVGGHDVDVEGTLAYVVEGTAGLSIVDVSDPMQPFVVSRRPDLAAGDVDVAGDHAYTNAGGFTALDLTDPLDPSVIGGIPLSSQRIEVENGLVYVLAGQTLRVRGFDLAAPPCSDGLDDDGDSAIDASDQGCDAPEDHSERFHCSDGVDNDADGSIDAADPGCFEADDPTEGFDCSDGVDNDADGRVDLADPDCSDASDPREQPACADGVDNDGDALVDHPADPGCTAGTDATERFDCDDGIDNDGDGSVDAADPGCLDAGSSLENPRCQDGIDNDGRPGIDFDGGASLDLDGDGRIDSAFNPGSAPVAEPDPQCAGNPWRNAEGSACGLGAELTLLLSILGSMSRRRRLHHRGPHRPDR